MNAGPARIAQHHTTLAYCRELGVPVEVFTNQNAAAFYYQQHSGGARGGLAGRAVRQRVAKADTFGYLSELLAKCAQRGSLDDELSADDRERLVLFLRPFGALNEADRYLGSRRRQGRDVDRPFALAEVLGAALGAYFAFELDWDQAAPMFQPVGGMDMLPRAFERAIRGRIRYRASVKQVTTTNDGVTVVYDDESGKQWRVEADYCICTIPPTVLREISSNFAPDVKDALRESFGVPAGRIGLEYRRRFWEEDNGIFGGITHTNLDIEVIFYPSYGYLGRGGVINGYYNHFDNADAYGALSPEQREARALARGVLIHGEAYRSELRSSYSVEWSRERYSRGAWSLWPDFESARAFASQLGRGDRNVWFAGDHVSSAVGWQHGALEAARAAVTRLHERAVRS